MAGADAQLLIDLLAGKPAPIELDRAALEIARIEYPGLDAGSCIMELDRHALAIAERARDLSDGQNFVETASRYLFQEAGFRGNTEDYYNPANNCLNRVLETRVGLPITLSIIYIEVGRRLAKKVTGVGLPKHFVVRYDDIDYSALMDPFNGGMLLDLAQCCRLAQVEELPLNVLLSVDERYIALRMLNNLRRIYFSTRQPAKALRVLDLLIAAEPGSPDEHKQRATVLLQMSRHAEAATAFQKYLGLAPQAADRDDVEEQLRNIASWIASRN